MKRFIFCFALLSIIVSSVESIESTVPLVGSNRSAESYPQTNDPKIVFKYLTSKKSCFFKGAHYLSGQRIVRRNPCHICVCVRSSVECFWQSCPPPPEGCAVIPYPGVCNPSIYNCPIPGRNSTLYTKPRRGQRSGSGLKAADCVIRGIGYFTGETIGVASNNCLECRCAKNSMYCTPLCCFQRANVEENAGMNYRRIDAHNRVVDPNPLAHIYEDLGLPPSGTI